MCRNLRGSSYLKSLSHFIQVVQSNSVLKLNNQELQKIHITHTYVIYNYFMKWNALNFTNIIRPGSHLWLNNWHVTGMKKKNPILIVIKFYVTSVNNTTYKTNNNKSLSIFPLRRYDVKWLYIKSVIQA